MKNIQKIYEDSYRKIYNKRKGTSSLRILGTDTDGKKKVYEKEGNFFFCGFVSLSYMSKGKNRKLKKVLAKQGIQISKKYNGGFYIEIKKIGNRGNGDYEIQREAFNKVQDYIDSLGYDVYVNANLD